jgi:dephospho-CoA kinase
MNIALAGKSGSGKTTVAEYLVRRHGFARVGTGDVCREVCRILFDSEARKLLNEVTDAMKSVDNLVWLKAALRRAPSNLPIVFDSMRFISDYDLLSSRGYELWRIRASKETRWKRLHNRGQEFLEVDDAHRAESEIDSYSYDATIDNESGDLETLFSSIEATLTFPY